MPFASAVVGAAMVAEPAEGLAAVLDCAGAEEVE